MKSVGSLDLGISARFYYDNKKEIDVLQSL